MKTENQTFDSLISRFFTYQLNLQRSKKTLAGYAWVFRKLKAFLMQNNLQVYDKEAQERFLESVLGVYEYNELTNTKKAFVNKVRVLTEFIKTGTVLSGSRPQPEKVFQGQIGTTINEFISCRKVTYQLQSTSLLCYRAYLHGFYTFLLGEHVDSVEKIDRSVIFSYIETLDPLKSATMTRILQIIKNYLHYLFEHNYLRTDHSFAIPKGPAVAHRQVPSTFSAEEVKILLGSIDRNSPAGKRDYAIILLAAKLGMRSSDIRYLTFDHIKWQCNTLEFDQQKTGRYISLPLLPEIGNAIVDYLKYARPVSRSKRVFLQQRSPYPPLGRTMIGSMVAVRLQESGINCFDRKKGPHTLRHSFAGALLSNKVPIPVISEAMGHSSSVPTMNYLRIDKETLLQCALDVPTVPFSFYEQKGGLSHG